MQGGEPLPAHVLRFLADQIESVPHLEALLLLWQSPERGWSLEEIATRVYVPRDAAAHLLADLARRGMVKIESGAGPPIVTHRIGRKANG